MPGEQAVLPRHLVEVGNQAAARSHHCRQGIDRLPDVRRVLQYSERVNKRKETPGEWEGVSARAGIGLWCALRRAA